MSPEPPAQPDRKGIDRELRRGSLELAILHLLSSGEAYGYEIVSKLTARTNGALEITDGTLYPVLYRLERAGFVNQQFDRDFLQGMVNDPARLTKISHTQYMRESGSEGIEMVMWLAMRGALGPRVREAYRFYRVPTSNTAAGLLCLEAT